ncbi:phosphoribosylformylglycinamidine synthase [Erysipelotrichaceae bacterium MTC7]|nr:phosphoribosylformylglycinamidine synthase [Erysipelotrichaceae bacterium MTC7]
MKKRLFVRKKAKFNVEATSICSDINHNLQITSVQGVQLYNIYDIFDADAQDIELLQTKVLSEIVTDEVYESVDTTGKTYIAYESLPGQFDQRADSAQACLMLLNNKSDVIVKSGRLVILEGTPSDDEIAAIKHYLINPVEMREKDLTILENDEDVTVEPVLTLDGFIEWDEQTIKNYRAQEGLAMSDADLLFIQEYFQKEDRNPTITEIKVLDTYWSDHCRHTTFETVLTNIVFEEGTFQERIQEAYEGFLDLHKKANKKDKPITLMNMATVAGKYMRQNGLLDDLEVSDEINACSIEITVDVNGKEEPYLLMFKNETHNHPTEIEPFGGASTCIGGAIRDPLSGRSYVYQAMRITGAGDINKPIADTLPNKLPQRVISKGAANGYSSYGNQIGLATTYVKEIFDEGYVAKRMEVGAVVGAAPKENVMRLQPQAGDIVVLLGGETGRDGIGGATGSSKEHTETSLTKSSSEVQKGNAPIERKLQRLFRNPDCTRLIKKANDFGAGGVSVAIGELADGIHINLDKVPTKYAGLNGTELAISESQERMACVIEPEAYEAFKTYAYQENLQTYIVAEISDDNRLMMNFKGETIVDIDRRFLDTNGVRQKQDVVIEDYTTTEENPFTPKHNTVASVLQDPNVASQRGLVEMFDATIGASTVLMPFGGKYQMTESQASVQKVSVFGHTNTASVMSYGYQPSIAKYSPYLGAAYSVVEALAKLVAVGASYEHARLSNQEYFERLGNDPKKWGKPTQALLGLIEAQMAFETPSIGGKDSMSGTYKDLTVPPTLITFAVTTEHVDAIVSNELKEEKHFLYYVKHKANRDGSPNYNQLKKIFTLVKTKMDEKTIVAANAVGYGGVAEALCKMSFGNKVGIQVTSDENLFVANIGSFVVESTTEIEDENFILLGQTSEELKININDETFKIDEAIDLWEARYKEIYPTTVHESAEYVKKLDYVDETVVKANRSVDKPKVIIPVFPGNNCEYDCKKAFEKAGADAEIYVFNNISVEATKQSIDTLATKIANAQILMIPGGFSSGDEPDGSGKFIANVLMNDKVNDAVQTLLANDGLILGICNGFQALIKSGLLPYGDIAKLDESSPTLFRNDINRHVSHIATTRVSSTMSPWLKGFQVEDTHKIAMSHGEGKFVVSEKEAQELFENGQVATQYADLRGRPTMSGVYNINGSTYAIEGITSRDGRIFGKMGHSERYEDGLFKNIYGDKLQDIFKNGVDYFKK